MESPVEIPERYLGESYLPDIGEGLIVDVGAFVGYTAMAFRRWFPDNQVIAIEPLWYDELVRNCDKEIKMVRNAISSPAMKHQASNMAISYQGKSGHAKIITLDELIHDRVAFLKIDTEGHEAHVLQGAKGLIERYKPVIEVEHFWTPDVLDAFLSRQGYQLWQQLYPDRIYVHEYIDY